MNPHLFRDCAVTSIAINDPDHVQSAAQLLGHSSLNTTEEHYIHAQAHKALGGFHEQLLAMRAAAKKQRRKNRANAFERTRARA